jgi:hypothetical protein
MADKIMGQDHVFSLHGMAKNRLRSVNLRATIITVTTVSLSISVCYLDRVYG